MSQCPDGKVRHLKKAVRSTTIKEEGIMHIVSCDITTIITGAQLVMIMNGIIYEVTKTRFLEECMPKTDIIQNAYKNKTKNKIAFRILPVI